MANNLKVEVCAKGTAETCTRGAGNRSIIKPLPKDSKDIQYAILILEMIGGYDITFMTEQEILDAARKACHI